MISPNDEQLVQFQRQSDQAFLDMQKSADKEMQAFLDAYSENHTLTSFQTPDFVWGKLGGVPLMGAAASASGVAKVVDKVTEGVAAAAKRAGQALGTAVGAQTGPQIGMHALGGALKQQMTAHAQDLRQDTMGVLQQTKNDLGERAKREAQAMRDTARKVMSEEASLRGMAQRAKKELQAAKERITGELLEVGQGVLGQLEDVAVDKVEEMGGQGDKGDGRLDLNDLWGVAEQVMKSKK